MGLENKNHPVWIILGEVSQPVIRFGFLLIPMVATTSSWDGEWMVLGTYATAELATVSNAIRARFTNVQVPDKRPGQPEQDS
jgi:hypothetical protein